MMKFVLVLLCCFMQVLTVPIKNYANVTSSPTPLSPAATLHTQIGLSQAVINQDAAFAKSKIKLELENLNTSLTSTPIETECRTQAANDIANLQTELMTVFNKCQMKPQMQALRFQAMSLKQKITVNKLEQKACSIGTDPSKCKSDSFDETATNLNNDLVNIMDKAENCMIDVKTDMLSRITDINTNLIAC